jgi:hypothetical protein
MNELPCFQLANHGRWSGQHTTNAVAPNYGSAAVNFFGEKSISVLKNTEFEQTNSSFDSEWHLHRTLDKVFWQPQAPVRVIIRRVQQES